MRRRINPGIVITRFEQLPLLGDKIPHLHLRFVEKIRFFHHCEIGLEGNLDRTVVLPGFGGDHDYAIPRLGSPDGSGGSILQHRNTFYIVWVDIVDTALIRKIIYHDQGLRIAKKRASPTDTDRLIGAYVPVENHPRRHVFHPFQNSAAHPSIYQLIVQLDK